MYRNFFSWFPVLALVLISRQLIWDLCSRQCTGNCGTVIKYFLCRQLQQGRQQQRPLQHDVAMPPTLSFFVRFLLSKVALVTKPCLVYESAIRFECCCVSWQLRGLQKCRADGNNIYGLASSCAADIIIFCLFFINDRSVLLCNPCVDYDYYLGFEYYYTTTLKNQRSTKLQRQQQQWCHQLLQLDNARQKDTFRLWCIVNFCFMDILSHILCMVSHLFDVSWMCKKVFVFFF